MNKIKLNKGVKKAQKIIKLRDDWCIAFGQGWVYYGTRNNNNKI